MKREELTKRFQWLQIEKKPFGLHVTIVASLYSDRHLWTEFRQWSNARPCRLFAMFDIR